MTRSDNKLEDNGHAIALSHNFKISDFEEELLNHEVTTHLKLAQIPIRKQC